MRLPLPGVLTLLLLPSASNSAAPPRRFPQWWEWRVFIELPLSDRVRAHPAVDTSAADDPASTASEPTPYWPVASIERCLEEVVGTPSDALAGATRDAPAGGVANGAAGEAPPPRAWGDAEVKRRTDVYWAHSPSVGVKRRGTGTSELETAGTLGGLEVKRRTRAEPRGAELWVKEIIDGDDGDDDDGDDDGGDGGDGGDLDHCLIRLKRWKRWIKRKWKMW